MNQADFVPLKPIPIKDRISMIFVYYGRIDVKDGAFVVVDEAKGERKHIPVGSVACIMLEPGTRISHAAVKLAAITGTLLIWVGEAGESLLGLWSLSSAPLGLTLHVAFEVAMSNLLDAPKRLESQGVIPLSFFGAETTEPSVIGWMPAASPRFRRWILETGQQWVPNWRTEAR